MNELEKLALSFIQSFGDWSLANSLELVALSDALEPHQTAIEGGGCRMPLVKQPDDGSVIYGPLHSIRDAHCRVRTLKGGRVSDSFAGMFLSVEDARQCIAKYALGHQIPLLGDALCAQQ